jgi:hypothetical protein
MKVIELTQNPLSLQHLLELVQSEEVLLTQDGHAIARFERFTDEDWEDWSFDHAPKVIRQSQAARERLKRGEGQTLDEVAKELNIALLHHQAAKR